MIEVELAIVSAPAVLVEVVRSFCNAWAVLFQFPTAPSQPDIERPTANGNGSFLVQSQDHLVEGTSFTSPIMPVKKSPRASNAFPRSMDPHQRNEISPPFGKSGAPVTHQLYEGVAGDGLSAIGA